MVDHNIVYEIFHENNYFLEKECPWEILYEFLKEFEKRTCTDNETITVDYFIRITGMNRESYRMIYDPKRRTSRKFAPKLSNGQPRYSMSRKYILSFCSGFTINTLCTNVILSKSLELPLTLSNEFDKIYIFVLEKYRGRSLRSKNEYIVSKGGEPLGRLRR